MSAEQLEQMKNSLGRPRPELHLLGAGWVFMSPELGGAAGELPTGMVEVDELELGFPFDQVLAAEDRLLVMGVDVPHNDGPFGVPPSPESTADEPEDEELSEADRIRRRIQELDSATGRLYAGEMADFLVALSESDGGLILEVTARRPGGGGAAANARFLRMVLLATRFAVAPIHRQLDRELGDARIEVEGEDVVASVTVSGATLVDTVATYAARQRELRDLRRRLTELE